MDNQRFDALTRAFAMGTSRRTAIKGIFGGAVGVAVATTRLDRAGAQTCEERVDCENVQQESCTDICPEGSQPGNNRGLSGVCCTGNGLCCSNNCVNGVCDGTEPECSSDGDCGACQECEGGACVDLTCCDSECEPCSSCVDDGCVPYAEYCPETQQCYNTGTGGCCYDNECGCGACVQGQCTIPACCSDEDCPGGSCVNGECVIEVCFERIDCVNVQQPSCPHLCPAGSFPGSNNRALDGVCCQGNGNGTCCSNNCVDGICVGGPPPPECENTSDCGDCEVCDSGTCIPTECCYDYDCPDCSFCSSDGVCVENLCLIGEECCNGECVPNGECCRDFGDYCGVLEITVAGGEAQLDCCDGLLCCAAQGGHVCAECCDDHDCDEDGYCWHGYCEYPKSCKSDGECPKGTCCCKDGNCSSKCCNHPPKPPKPPKPAPPAPVKPSGGTASSLPATGAGPSDEKNSFLGVAALGAAAAVLAARKMRETPGEATSQE